MKNKVETRKTVKTNKKFLEEIIDECSPKFLVFKDKYLKGADASEAAVEAGYSSASGIAARLAHKVGTTVARELRKLGIDELGIAQKLAELIGAQKPVWNPAKECFELFANGSLQLQALTEAAQYLKLREEKDKGTGTTIVVMSEVPRPDRSHQTLQSLPEAQRTIDGEVVH